MASIRKEVVVEVAADTVWAAIRDLGALSRLAPGVVADSHMEGGKRMLTYATGVVLRESVVDLNDDERRLVVTSTGGNIAHLNSSVQVFPDGEKRTRVVWVCDFLPNLLADAVADILERSITAAKTVLEKEGWQ